MKNSDINNLLILTGIYLLLFGISELLFIKANLKAENTRKFIHVSCGIVSLSYVFLFETIWPVLIITVSFAALLYISKKLNFLNSIHKVKRQTFGSYLFPLALLFCFIVYLYLDNSIYYYLPFTIMVISDPLAAFFGKIMPLKTYKSGRYCKSIGGTIAFFISASLISFLLCFFLLEIGIFKILLISPVIGIISSLTEAFCKNGIDNILVPIVVVVTMYILHF
jgi:phytol kinase